MNGLELARAFYADCGRPMLEREFPELLPFLAVGLFGSGSECFGYDDEISRDHDFEPGFCILLPEEELVDARSEFRLERAYAALPKSFAGFARASLAPVGGARHGVFRTAAFFSRAVGSPNGLLTREQWLTLPEHALAEATNGALFSDPFGEVTRIRETLAAYPEDIRRKRLAGQLWRMGQSGQYNLPRCLKRGDAAAARLCCVEFVQAALAAVFLLNRRYAPYYKWRFRALRELPRLSELSAPLERLLSESDPAAAETVSAAVLALAREEGLCKKSAELERAAYEVNDAIRDGSLRNLHLLAAL